MNLSVNKPVMDSPSQSLKGKTLKNFDCLFEIFRFKNNHIVCLYKSEMLNFLKRDKGLNKS